ncbi:unnamed protein product [marine sediment metagenome]|uniref:Uncharacterized protein n=1 Tax=marine sediment metagenome TaxID=412755 RepID=X0UFF4_9ZZZZ
MADDFENQTNDLFQSATLLADTLRRTIDPADRLGESFAALRAAADSLDIQQSSGMERLDSLAADLRSPRAMPPEELDSRTRPASAAAPGSGLSHLPELFARSATRDGQQEQIKLVQELLAEQKRANEHLQTIADKNSQDTLGP